jgi:hypothetical protein
MRLAQQNFQQKKREAQIPRQNNATPTGEALNI